MSLRLSPAASAGLFSTTFVTSAPLGRSSPRLSEISFDTLCMVAPSHGRRTCLTPPLAAATTMRTILAGIAKPMPTLPPDCEKIAELMPTSRAFISTSAPPELPGLIAASVWMKKP